MNVFRDTAFLACMLVCGVAILFASYHSNSTAIGSNQLTDWQMRSIYGGQDEDPCTPTTSVEGCAPADSPNVHFVPKDRAEAWDPPKSEDFATDEAFSEAYLASRPDCGDDIETVVPGGTSATGDDAELIEDGEVVCSKIWPVTRSSVVQNARTAPPEIGPQLVAHTRCVVDDDVSTHCVVCEVGSSIDGEPRPRYFCPDDE